MRTTRKIGIGAFVLLMGASLLAMRPHGPAERSRQQPTGAVLKLASVSTSARRDVDYHLLDTRLTQLMTKPRWSGLRSEWSKTAGSRSSKVMAKPRPGRATCTPDTVFRWASVSKGLAATMVAKLAEQGKINLQAPVANYAPDLKLPAGNEYRATVGDLLSHRLGLYRNAYDNKLEEGQDPSFLRPSLAQLNAVCGPAPAGTIRMSPLMRRARWSPAPPACPTSRRPGESVQSDRDDAAAACRSPGSNRTRAGRGRMRPAAERADGRHLLQSARRRRHQQQHQGHERCGCSRRWARCRRARRQGARYDPRALCGDPDRTRAAAQFLERLGTAWYGYGWRSYDYAGHHIIGHRGGISGYRSLILFDPEKKSGVVALWNSNTNQPGGLEFEVMDMIYHLPFRDWLELDAKAPAQTIARGRERSGEWRERRPPLALTGLGARLPELALLIEMGLVAAAHAGDRGGHSDQQGRQANAGRRAWARQSRRGTGR